MDRIFISYKRLDKEKVFKIKNEIESKLNTTCWIDLDGIESDSQFASTICTAINNCDIFLFMLSKHHLEITDYRTDWTMRELNFAQQKNKRIVIINIDNSPLSDRMQLEYGTQQQIDYNNADIRRRLFIDLGKWLEVNPRPTKIVTRANTSLPLKQKSGNGAKWIICALIVVVLILGGLFMMNKKDDLSVPARTESAAQETQDAGSDEMNAEKIEATADEAAQEQATTAEKPVEKQMSHQELYSLGENCYKRQDYAKAVDYYFQSADLGNMKAQAALGHCYLTGTGIEKDEAEAIVWYTKAANQGDADSQFALGLCHALGQGTPEDYTKAAAWFKKAADQGHEKAEGYLKEISGLLND